MAYNDAKFSKLPNYAKFSKVHNYVKHNTAYNNGATSKRAL